MTQCTCMTPPFSHLDYDTIVLGDDPAYTCGEVRVDTCKVCGAMWVNYLIEEPHYTRSGRWWRAPLKEDNFPGLTSANAKAYIEAQEWCFVGGSYHDGPIQKQTKPIAVR